MIKNDQKWSKNDQKMIKIENREPYVIFKNLYIRLLSNFEISKKWSKWSKMIKNDQKWSKNE